VPSSNGNHGPIASTNPNGDSCIDPAVIHLVLAAKEFCRLLESQAALSQRDPIQQLLTAILALYGAGLKLPEVDPEATPEEPFFDLHSRKAFRAQLAERLGELPSLEGSYRPIATLADDLSGRSFPD